ncbi:helix-turn-helix domain-containing protein [Haladaptatus sp. CMAA 1911]|uniref:DUF7437 domain-containing protein n=1 Tax=unclassified Haladaptatus TaxID=2622732 RepID=UPI0037549D3A
MSHTASHANGDVIRDFLSIADLLEEPRLAQLYAYFSRQGPATVQELMDALDLPQGTAYTYVKRLADAGVIEATGDEQPRTYVAHPIDLTVSAGDGTREYTITPMLVDAVSRQSTNDDIETYIARHGIAGLATALTYTVARERGEVTHRLMARDLDISPLAAEIILQALRPVVHDYIDIEESGAVGPDLGLDDEQTAETSDET